MSREIGELASVKIVEGGEKKKNRQGKGWEEYLHLGVRKRKKSNYTSQRSWGVNHRTQLRLTLSRNGHLDRMLAYREKRGKPAHKTMTKQLRPGARLQDGLVRS